MVAKIVSGKSIRGMLHYNELKVTQDEARLILSSGFATDVNGMSVEQKLQRFEHRTMLNAAVKTNAIHISLNFDEKDKLNDTKLQAISVAYMDRIGFGEQPFLVYRHTDAAHTHVHIATTNIRADGGRIDIHNIGRTLSEDARKALEKEYGLVKAEGRQLSNVTGIKAADIEKAIYGQHLTKRAITNIVNAVIRSYKFSSLAEFNAILKQFNVTADRGSENTIMYQKNGLLYSIINQQGQKVGVPIKASTIYNKPTLANLETKFDKGTEKRKPFNEPLKEAIDKVFFQYKQLTRATFTTELEKQGIHVAFRENAQGLTYGITYVDNRHKTVFNGSDLGKAYSAKGINDRFGDVDIPLASQKEIKQVQAAEQKTYLKPTQNTNYLKSPSQTTIYLQQAKVTPLLKALVSPAQEGTPFIKKKKKRRKKQQTEQQAVQQPQNP